MAVLLSCFACVVLAQAATPQPAPAATSRTAPASAPVYVSPFNDYLRFDPDAPLKPWRAANDDVRDAGGHVGILKGMSSPAAATAAGKSPSGGEAPKSAPSSTTDKATQKPGATGHSHGAHK